MAATILISIILVALSVTAVLARVLIADKSARQEPPRPRARSSPRIIEHWRERLPPD